MVSVAVWVEPVAGLTNWGVMLKSPLTCPAITRNQNGMFTKPCFNIPPSFTVGFKCLSSISGRLLDLDGFFFKE